MARAVGEVKNTIERTDILIIQVHISGMIKIMGGQVIWSIFVGARILVNMCHLSRRDGEFDILGSDAAGPVYLLLVSQLGLTVAVIFVQVAPVLRSVATSL